MSSGASRDPKLIATLERTPPAVCWDLLATTSVGRMCLLVDGKPEVLPVNLAIDGASILFRIEPDKVTGRWASVYPSSL